MRRDDYAIFSEGKIGKLNLPNRLVRSSTWDPSILSIRQLSDEVLNLYRNLALGGIGLIITGGFPVFRERNPKDPPGEWLVSFPDLRVKDLERMIQIVRDANSKCRIVAQLENGNIAAKPSDVRSPFSKRKLRILNQEEISDIVDCFVEAIIDVKETGFDGVQLHAAHGGLLSRFLSSYSNRRDDTYGGSASKRARIINEIVSKARNTVGDYPILIKMNCTDYMIGGTDIDTFSSLAKEIENTGVDAIEISGGMWDCLFKSEEELGFRPVPAPESHTRIRSPEKQSYFLKYAEKLNLSIPIIMVGGNRHIERLESIIKQGKVDFISLSRPLICEPDLPNRWLEGRGGYTTECISCNSCIYNMYVHPGKPKPGLVTCVYKEDKEIHKLAQKWLSSWGKKRTISK
ncbi:MAG: NADH:flavin oxidoreductase [Candidatus Heimdallarchaeota archaeon]|nr:NADH:flavin oxidoreductase [Candidatus Heimdallarchaeota archaeon]MCK4955265.1 NADH:flavin oxidoreductase [Candidatus Heimdallarchaeota archaeon]